MSRTERRLALSVAGVLGFLAGLVAGVTLAWSCRYSRGGS